MAQYKFFVQEEIDNKFNGGLVEGETIKQWFDTNQEKLSDSFGDKIDFSELSEKLLLEGKKDFLIWDDILKAAEMSFFADNVPFEGPSIDFCCGYGFWTSKIIQKIDLGVDLFPDEGGYNRSIEGFVEKNFIDRAYRSVLQADITKELPLPDNYFNSVIAVCSLEHIDEVEKVLETMHKIITDNGKLYLSLQTDKYIKVFEKIFNPEYVKWVRDNFEIKIDRSWSEWERLLDQAGFTIESKKFILSEEETKIKAITYWENPFDPVWGKLGLENAIKDIPEFRKFYFNKVKEWSQETTEADNASIACYICQKKII